MYKLFIDESGKNTLKTITSWPPHFSIGGAMVHEHAAEFIKVRGDQIKFKYWGCTDVTFHATEIRGLKGSFRIFKDITDSSGNVLVDKSKIRGEFYEDFLTYVRKSTFRFIHICVNKDHLVATDPTLAHAINNGWIVTGFEKNLTRKVFREVVKVYSCYLNKKGYMGQIVVEASDMTQDGDILSIYNQVMFQGIPEIGLDTLSVREILTSISFATKNNRDAETQLADIGGYFLSLKARKEDGVERKPLTVFEEEMIKIFESKAFVDKCDPVASKSIKRL